MARRVREDVERLVLVLGPVQEQPGAQLLGSLAMALELLATGDGEVEVELHGHVVLGPRRRGELADLLDRHDPPTVRVEQDQPVRGVVTVRRGSGRLRAVP